MSRRLVVSALLLAWPVASWGLTYRVPDQHSRIQDAIDLASPSAVDTVLLSAGTYNERISIRFKHLVLRGTGSAEMTTINGGFQGNVITVNGVGRTCVIEDLTVTGGDATHPDSVGAAIYLNQYASPTIQRCRLIGNRARAGGAIAAYVFCEPLVRDCWIADNSGGAVVFELAGADMGTTWAEMENCVIVNNQGFGVSVLKGARAWLRNCTLAYNADALGASLLARVRVERSIVAFSGGAGIRRYDGSACLTLTCNDVFGNTGGNYVGSNPSDPCFSGRGNGDVTVDPCFQNPENDNFHLHQSSPLCALRGPGSCGVVGAYNDPCGPNPGQCIVSVQQADWTALKNLYR